MDAPLDLVLLRTCSTTKYHRRTILDADIAQLGTLGYHIESIDGASRDAFLRDMTRAGRFQEQFGYEPWTGNLNALLDAMRYAEVDGASGMALGVSRFDLLLDSDHELAEGVLDVVETASRERLIDELITGQSQRLILLVQSDRGDLELPPLVGSRNPPWNQAEMAQCLAEARRRVTAVVHGIIQSARLVGSTQLRSPQQRPGWLRRWRPASPPESASRSTSWGAALRSSRGCDRRASAHPSAERRKPCDRRFPARSRTARDRTTAPQRCRGPSPVRCA